LIVNGVGGGGVKCGEGEVSLVVSLLYEGPWRLLAGVTEAAIAVFMTLGEVDHNSTCTYQIGFYETRNSSCKWVPGGLPLGHIQNITSVGRLFDFLNNPRF
jgi:hypothetical protein